MLCKLFKWNFARWKKRSSKPSTMNNSKKPLYKNKKKKKKRKLSWSTIITLSKTWRTWNQNMMTWNQNTIKLQSKITSWRLFSLNSERWRWRNWPFNIRLSWKTRSSNRNVTNLIIWKSLKSKKMNILIRCLKQRVIKSSCWRITRNSLNNLKS